MEGGRKNKIKLARKTDGREEGVTSRGMTTEGLTSNGGELVGFAEGEKLKLSDCLMLKR